MHVMAEGCGLSCEHDSHVGPAHLWPCLPFGLLIFWPLIGGIPRTDMWMHVLLRHLATAMHNWPGMTYLCKPGLSHVQAGLLCIGRAGGRHQAQLAQRPLPPLQRRRASGRRPLRLLAPGRRHLACMSGTHQLRICSTAQHAAGACPACAARAAAAFSASLRLAVATLPALKRWMSDELQPILQPPGGLSTMLDTITCLTQRRMVSWD